MLVASKNMETPWAEDCERRLGQLWITSIVASKDVHVPACYTCDMLLSWTHLHASGPDMSE